MSVFTIHGIKNNTQKENMLDRGLLDYQKYYQFLKSRPDKFVSIEDSLNNKGDALTIDDSTRASMDAAILAAEYGHKVTIFLNPWNIIHNKPYHFHLLNSILENSIKETYLFNGFTWNLRTYNEKHFFREYIKRRFWKYETNIDKLYNTIQTLGLDLTKENYIIPDALKIITEEDIKKMVNMGIDVECHGWTHINTAELTDKELENHINSAKEWLEAITNGININYYSTPFGSSMPSRNYYEKMNQLWFLLDSSKDEGFINKKVFNRDSLHL